MSPDQVKALLTTLLNMVKAGEVQLPNLALLPKIENDLNYVLAHPLMLEIASVAFSTGDALLSFLLGKFGIPLSAVEQVLATANLRSA